MFLIISFLHTVGFNLFIEKTISETICQLPNI